MMKTTGLVCAALLTFTASGFAMHQAGWFNGKTQRRAESCQVRSNDSVHSDAALRYRHNQNTSWRLVMSIR